MEFLIYAVLSYLLVCALTTVVDNIQHYSIPTKHWYEICTLTAVIIFTRIIAYFVKK